MRLRWAALAAAVLACLLVETGTAAGYSVRGRQLTRIELEGSNGYSILIVADRNQHLTLTTTKEPFTTEYLTHDVLADPNRVGATMPGLGSVSVRFHPSGPAHRAPAFPGCMGPRPMVREGVVRGLIEFAGEREYTRVESREAAAKIEEWKRQRCRSGASPEPIDLSLRDWISKFSTGALGIQFLARKYRPGVLEGGNRVLYSVETEGSSGPHAPFVHRRALVEAPLAAFDAHPEHTAISPPPPFTGTGTFARTPESVFAWEGDLAIQFPGVDPLGLTGPSFESNYCRREVGCFRQHVESPDGAF